VGLPKLFLMTIGEYTNRVKEPRELMAQKKSYPVVASVTPNV